mmetsp:Transcript_15581/g.36743  ORF Transcript_15581/g.36743 Transcript_15581/m.36743 type:complete len:616 (+) Transcript_15581:79-1926(+)
MPAAPQMLGGGKKGSKEALPALCWKERGEQRLSLSQSDEVRCQNLELLDYVIGHWKDQNGSTYSVQLDPGSEQSSATVFTTRPSGRTIKTKGLIRIRQQKIYWGNSFQLDCANAGWEEITWSPISHCKRSFKWTRNTAELSKNQVREKVLAIRACQKYTYGYGSSGYYDHDSSHYDYGSGPLRHDYDSSQRLAICDASKWEESTQDQSPAADAEAWEDLRDESDDDDIVAVPHPWKYERRPIPVEEIRWSQETIGIRFRDGTLLFDTLQQMLDGKIKPEVLPTFRVVLFEDNLFAVTGNRRLWVLRAYQRLSGKPVSVIAECHPPKAMESRWCQRRYSTSNCGEKIWFVCKSFADRTYESMQDALWAASQRKEAQTLAKLEAAVEAKEQTKVSDEKGEASAKELDADEVDRLEEEYCFCARVDSIENGRQPDGASRDAGEDVTELVTDDEEERYHKQVDDVAQKVLQSLLGKDAAKPACLPPYVPSYMPATAAQALLREPMGDGSLDNAAYQPDPAFPWDLPSNNLMDEGWIDCSACQAPMEASYDFPGYFQPDWEEPWQMIQGAVNMEGRPIILPAAPGNVWMWHLNGQLAGLHCFNNVQGQWPSQSEMLEEDV